MVSTAATAELRLCRPRIGDSECLRLRVAGEADLRRVGTTSGDANKRLLIVAGEDDLLSTRRRPLIRMLLRFRAGLRER